MAVVYLVRHAQAEGNVFRRFDGWYDGSVTALGRKQIQALETRFRDLPIEAVYASDLRRTMATAQAAARPHGLDIIPEPGLREASMGIYEDLPQAEMLVSHAEEFRRFSQLSPLWAPEGGETFHQVAHRMVKTFFRLASMHPNGTIALFSHSVAIHCLQAALMGKAPEELPWRSVPNTGVSCYEIKGDKLRTVFENDASHLSPALFRDMHKIPQVFFRPLDPGESQDQILYRQARTDAWLKAHPDLLDFNGPGFLEEAAMQRLWDPRALQKALLDGEPVGVLQLATLRDAAQGVGHITLLWVREDLRRQGVGSQLLGQAAATYRSMGRKRLHLQCSPVNRTARQFYEGHDFRAVARVPGVGGELELLEKEL